MASSSLEWLVGGRVVSHFSLVRRCFHEEQYQPRQVSKQNVPLIIPIILWCTIHGDTTVQQRLRDAGVRPQPNTPAPRAKSQRRRRKDFLPMNKKKRETLLKDLTVNSTYKVHTVDSLTADFSITFTSPPRRLCISRGFLIIHQRGWMTFTPYEETMNAHSSWNDRLPCRETEPVRSYARNTPWCTFTESASVGHQVGNQVGRRASSRRHQLRNVPRWSEHSARA